MEIRMYQKMIFIDIWINVFLAHWFFLFLYLEMFSLIAFVRHTLISGKEREEINFHEVSSFVSKTVVRVYMRLLFISFSLFPLILQYALQVNRWSSSHICKKKTATFTCTRFYVAIIWHSRDWKSIINLGIFKKHFSGIIYL